MIDFYLPGPWPRQLTQDEIEEIKARAMIQIGELVMQQLPNLLLNLGDQIHCTYVVNCGTLVEVKAVECGAMPPNGGPVCRLNKGHHCEHSSVVRWK